MILCNLNQHKFRSQMALFLMRILILVGVSTGCTLAGVKNKAIVASDDGNVKKLSFWNKPQEGTNFFNEQENDSRIRAARHFGIDFVRLAPNKWPSKKRDFLIGNADNYQGLVEEDLNTLKSVLASYQELNMKVVLCMLSLPGLRWRQQNENQWDHRIWHDEKYHEQAAYFWRDLAAELKDYEHIIGYDIINEPAPERATGFQDWYTEEYASWYDKIKNTPANLNRLYSKVIKAIRSVDDQTPIIIESGFHASPWAIEYLEGARDLKVLYSIHHYEPFQYTSHKNKDQYRYPGNVPTGENQSHVKLWNKESMQKYFDKVWLWQKKHAIPSERILVGEFGVGRRNPGAAEYLQDSIAIFNEFKWHWAFYSFREDSWTEMDYELGTKPLPKDWWEQANNSKQPIPRPYEDRDLFNVILSGFRR